MALRTSPTGGGRRPAGRGRGSGHRRRRLAEGDRSALDDPDACHAFERAVTRLEVRRPSPPGAFKRAAVNAALRQAFTVERSPE